MDKERKPLFISPVKLGCHLKSFKTRPNNKCLCGSGKKQKKCCGDQSKFGSTRPPERESI